VAPKPYEKKWITKVSDHCLPSPRLPESSPAVISRTGAPAITAKTEHTYKAEYTLHTAAGYRLSDPDKKRL
jgi:hypothetical protein